MRSAALAERIYDYYSNTMVYFEDIMKVGNLAKPMQWLEAQDRWARQQVLKGVSTACLIHAHAPAGRHVTRRLHPSSQQHILGFVCSRRR